MTPQEKADIDLLDQDTTHIDLFRTLPVERRTEVVCRHAVELSGENIRYVPQTLRTRALCRMAVRQWPFALDYVPEKLKTASMYREAVRYYGSALAYVAAEYRTESLCMQAVRNDPWALFFVPEKIMTPKICMQAIKADGMVLRYVPPTLKTPDLCRIALKASPYDHGRLQSVLEDIPFPEICLEGLKKYRQEGFDMMGLLAGIAPTVLDDQIALYCVQNDPSCLMLLPEDLKTDRICYEAVQRDGILLHNVPSRMRSADMCEAAVLNNVHALQYVPDNLHTRELYRKALEVDPFAIRHFKSALLTREDCEVAYINTTSWKILRFIPFPDLLERILDERCQSYSATQSFLNHVNPDVLTPRLAEKIFIKEPELFSVLPLRLRDVSLCEAAVKVNGNNLKYVPEKFKTPELCMSAIRQTPFSIAYLPDTMKTRRFYLSLIEENPRNLHGIPLDNRTEEMNRIAFENSYGRDPSDFSAIGAITRPELLLQVLRKENDPEKIDWLVNIISSRVMTEEMAYEAMRKNSQSLHLLPEKVISERIADLTVHADPRAIQWIPRHLRTADICLYAETNYPDLKIYVPESISQSENIYSFHRRVDDLLRQPLKYEEYKTIYNGGAVVVEGVQTSSGFLDRCQVSYNRQKDRFALSLISPKQGQLSKEHIKPQPRQKLKL